MTTQAKAQQEGRSGGLIAWLANSRLSFLIPFWFAEESYSGGVMLLCVKRHGREHFETYDWGAHTTAADKERLLCPAPHGTERRYEALQHLVRCGIVRRIGTFINRQWALEARPSRRRR